MSSFIKFTRPPYEALILDDPAPRSFLNVVAEEIEKEITAGSYKPLQPEDFNL